MGKRHYRINQYIKAEKVRLIGEDGKQLGVLPIFKAIQEARKREVDLVEVAPNANPPVCRLIDFKKFIYQEAKKQRESKKGQRGGELKEVRLSPFIAENDLDFRLKRVKEFLTQGNKVRLVVRFTGRQLSHKEFGDQIMEKALERIGQACRVDFEPKWQGRDYFAILAPLSNKITEENKNDKKKENEN